MGRERGGALSSAFWLIRPQPPEGKLSHLDLILFHGFCALFQFVLGAAAVRVFGAELVGRCIHGAGRPEEKGVLFIGELGGGGEAAEPEICLVVGSRLVRVVAVSSRLLGMLKS